MEDDGRRRYEEPRRPVRQRLGKDRKDAAKLQDLKDKDYDRNAPMFENPASVYAPRNDRRGYRAEDRSVRSMRFFWALLRLRLKPAMQSRQQSEEEKILRISSFTCDIGEVGLAHTTSKDLEMYLSDDDCGQDAKQDLHSELMEAIHALPDKQVADVLTLLLTYVRQLTLPMRTGSAASSEKVQDSPRLTVPSATPSRQVTPTWLQKASSSLDEKQRQRRRNRQDNDKSAAKGIQVENAKLPKWLRGNSPEDLPTPSQPSQKGESSAAGKASRRTAPEGGAPVLGSSVGRGRSETDKVVISMADSSAPQTSRDAFAPE
ncbi:hypothetical protein AK812_SmicGene35039, partial [Symbiodinium microadriaticum]